MATPVAREAVAKAVREAQEKRAAEPRASAPVVEGHDPDLKDALARLETAPSAAAHLRVGHAYYRLGIRDFAMDHYSDALTLDERNVAAFEGRARVWRDWGFVGLALADAHRARFYQPASATVRNTLGTVLELRGLCREALGEYREALRIEPNAAWAQQNVARLTDTCKAPGSTR
jgi:tetratricopeptide (TPR) repeat protein